MVKERGSGTWFVRWVVTFAAVGWMSIGVFKEIMCVVFGMVGNVSVCKILEEATSAIL